MSPWVRLLLFVALVLAVLGGLLFFAADVADGHYAQGNGIACVGWGASFDSWVCWEL